RTHRWPTTTPKPAVRRTGAWSWCGCNRVAGRARTTDAQAGARGDRRVGWSVAARKGCGRRPGSHAGAGHRMQHGANPMRDTPLETSTYLQRLGLAQRPAPTLATLRELQLRHTGAIAFETLSPMLHAPVPID